MAVAAQTQRDLVQDRAVATRDKLLEAAIRTFASVGYDAASTRQIEADAGVKRGLITYHFKTKDVLWKAASEWLFSMASEELASAERHAAAVDPLARMRYFIRAYVHFCARFPDVNRLMVQEGMRDDWRLDWLVDHVVRPWYRRVEQLFEGARELGIAPRMDFVHFYYILTGASALLFSMAPEARRLAGIDPKSNTVVEAHAEALAQLLFPGDSK